MFWRTQKWCGVPDSGIFCWRPKITGPPYTRDRADVPTIQSTQGAGAKLAGLLAALTQTAHHQQRLNKALRVGRVPGIVIKTLNALQAAGFEVDVIRRSAKDGAPHPFSQMVVAETGHMALMTTMNSVTFIALKKMISISAGRDPRKRLKDALQAELVQRLVTTHMPQYAPPSAIQVGS